MAGEQILEAGCGAGRFTEITLGTGAEVFSFDYSNAVDVNMANNGKNTNLHVFQADIRFIPLQENSFDRVFCFGVLQHCPDPRASFLSLIAYLRPEGEIAIDVYDLSIRTFVNPKYLLRPFLKPISPARLYGLVRKVVPVLFPVKMWVSEKVPFGKYFAFFIPIAYHKGFLPYVEGLSYDRLLEWSVLDTFDKFAPKYDKPQRLSKVRSWFADAGLKDVDVRYGQNGIVGRGIKP